MTEQQSHLDRGLDALRDAPPAPPMSEELERELVDLTAVRSRRPIRQLVIIVLLSMLYAGGMLAMFGVRPDLARLPWPLLLGWAALWLMSFVSIIWLIVVPAKGQVMPRARPAALVAAASGILAIVGGLLVPAAPAPVATASAAAVIEQANPCLSYGMLTALVPAVLAALAIRGAAPVSSRWSAAAIGAASGALGGLVLHLHCSLADPLHLGLVHGGVVILAALVTACIPGIGGISSHTKGD